MAQSYLPVRNSDPLMLLNGLRTHWDSLGHLGTTSTTQAIKVFIPVLYRTRRYVYTSLEPECLNDDNQSTVLYRTASTGLCPESETAAGGLRSS